MIAQDVFRDQPALMGAVVRCEPMTVAHFSGLWPMYQDSANDRHTGTHQRFTEEQIYQWCATRQQHHDRADWAIINNSDNTVLGEVVLNDLDIYNQTVNFRVSLIGPLVYGRGYGTEATCLVRDYAFNAARIHRIELQVYEFNTRAQRVYEKCGFISEGIYREALYWEGEWHNAILMAILATDPRPRLNNTTTI